MGSQIHPYHPNREGQISPFHEAMTLDDRHHVLPGAWALRPVEAGLRSVEPVNSLGQPR